MTVDEHMLADKRVIEYMGILTSLIKEKALQKESVLKYTSELLTDAYTTDEMNDLNYNIYIKVVANLNKLGYSTNIETQDEVNYLVISWRT